MDADLYFKVTVDMNVVCILVTLDLRDDFMGDICLNTA